MNRKVADFGSGTSASPRASLCVDDSGLSRILDHRESGASMRKRGREREEANSDPSFSQRSPLLPFAKLRGIG